MEAICNTPTNLSGRVQAATTGEPAKVQLRNISQIRAQGPSIYRISIEDHIWLELSLVGEVEAMYVEKNESERLYSVLTIVNERNPEIRSKIYQREKEIFAAYPHLYFDFHILPRLNRKLTEVVSNAERFYKRKA